MKILSTTPINLTMVPPLCLLRVLIAGLHVERVIGRPLLLSTTAQHRRNTKTHRKHR